MQELVFNRNDIRRFCQAFLCTSLLGLVSSPLSHIELGSQLFRCTNGKVFFQYGSVQNFPVSRIDDGKDGPGLPCREPSMQEILLHGGTELQQPDAVADGRAVLPHPLGQFLLGYPRFLNEIRIRLGFFNRIQILPLDILYERNFQTLHLGEVLDQYGDFGQSRKL